MHGSLTHRDNLRGFFDTCLPMLLKRVFGYDDFEASWLHAVKVCWGHAVKLSGGQILHKNIRLDILHCEHLQVQLDNPIRRILASRRGGSHQPSMHGLLNACC